MLRGTTPALLVAGFALYLVGLDAVEPLSQEIDHPDVADGVPRQRGWVLVRHLVAPALAVAPFALVGAATVALVEPEAGAAAFVLALPTTLAAACGAVVSVVRDAADPLQSASVAVPPEFAGFSSTIRVAIPLLISTIPTVAALVLREFPSAGNVGRIAVVDALLIAATAVWVRKSDEWRVKMRAFADAGRRGR